MADFILSCGSTVDLTNEHLAARDIHYIPFHFYVNDVHYLDDMGGAMPLKDFYNAMRAGADTKTSQVNTDEFLNYFRPFLQQGKDILHIGFSSGLSGSHNACVVAKQMLEEEFPERTVYLVDSLGASSGYGLIMETLADMRDAGMGIEELWQWANDHVLEMHHWFFSTDLTYYVKGGRVSKASGWFGTMLKICPLLNMDYMGRLVPRYKVRGKPKVKEMIVDKMAECAQGGEHYTGKCFVSHSDCYEDAREVADAIAARFPQMTGEPQIFPIGTTIGSHAGPGTVAVFFWGSKRED